MSVQDMSLDTRRKLVQMAAVAAWTDLDVDEAERELVLDLAARLALPDGDLDEVRSWLQGPPPEFDPYDIPSRYRAEFLEALLDVVKADGRLDPEECTLLALLAELMA